MEDFREKVAERLGHLHLVRRNLDELRALTCDEYRPLQAKLDEIELCVLNDFVDSISVALGELERSM